MLPEEKPELQIECVIQQGKEKKIHTLIVMEKFMLNLNPATKY